MESDKPEKELTESQKAFCTEWIFDFNGSRAYKAAFPGCQDSTARTEASKLLTNPNIRAYCKELQDNLAETAGISRLKVLREHEKLAFSSIAHLHNTWITRKEFEQLTDDEKACISEISTQTRTELINRGTDEETPVQVDYVKIKLWDKQKSLDSINKMLGYDAATKIDHTTNGKELTSNAITKIEIVKTNEDQGLGES
ncbi:MAG: terminase small subunit [Bacteroidota bacterium]